MQNAEAVQQQNAQLEMQLAMSCKPTPTTSEASPAALTSKSPNCILALESDTV